MYDVETVVRATQSQNSRRNTGNQTRIARDSCERRAKEPERESQDITLGAKQAGQPDRRTRAPLHDITLAVVVGGVKEDSNH